MKKKIKCDCGKLAVWYYMPSDRHNACCDDCVPRGCSCNTESIFLNMDNEIFANYPEGIEDKDWKWTEHSEYWCYIDEQGREYPCCEWWYDKEGWDNEEEVC